MGKARRKHPPVEGASRHVARPIIHIPEAQWRVVRCSIGRVRRAADDMRQRKWTYYLPTIVSETVRHGRKQRQERPALGYYLFVALDGMHPDAVLDLDDVWGFLADSDNRPLAVPAAALRDLESQCARGGVMPILTPGEAYRVKSGPFTGFWATFEASVSEFRARTTIQGRSVDLPTSALDTAA